MLSTPHAVSGAVVWRNPDNDNRPSFIVSRSRKGEVDAMPDGALHCRAFGLQCGALISSCARSQDRCMAHSVLRTRLGLVGGGAPTQAL